MSKPGLMFILITLYLAVGSPLYALNADADYQIGSGDVLRITIYDHPDMTTVARVDVEGNILFPLAGNIHVGGMTTSSASRQIAQQLDGDYIVNPQVAIFVEEFRSKKVMIIGQVVRPGLYELSGPTTLLELISKAGGLSDGAGKMATIRRPASSSGQPEGSISVDLGNLLKMGQASVDVPLYDGDTVTIAKSGVVYVTGQVRKPAAYAIDDDATVIKAITMAGGFTELAAQSKVKIIRKINGQEQVLEKVSMHEKLMPDDVMVVPESFF